MKCKRCGKEFEGNFCPNCGYSAEKNKETNVIRKDANVSRSRKRTAKKKKSMSKYMVFRMWCVTIGALVSAVCGFLSGKILAGCVFIICAILLCPVFIKEAGRKMIVHIIGAVFCVMFGIALWGPLEDTSIRSTSSDYSEEVADVRDYIGTWKDLSEKSCFMNIESDDSKKICIDIFWEEDNSIHMELAGSYDEKQGGIKYTGSKIVESYDDMGKCNEKIEYDDGKGLLYFNQDGELLWKDDTENLGKNCVFIRADDESSNESNSNDYTGIWLSQPSGQEAYTIYAEGIWIKNYTAEHVEFETAYFAGTPQIENHKQYKWEIKRNTTGTAEIVESDIAGIKCFFADDEKVYIDSDKLYYGEYQNEDLGLIKTGFQSLDFCTYYYNCDYGYCYNKMGGVTLEKHGINNEFLNDEYWYLHFRKFTNGSESIQVELSNMWEPNITFAVQHYKDEFTPDSLWYFDLKSDGIGKDGELIYSPEEVFWSDYNYILHYYPEDCHLYIETEDPEIVGEYAFDGEYNRTEWRSFIDENIKSVALSEKVIEDSVEYNDEQGMSIEDSISEDDALWFITYNTFIKDGTADMLQVKAMTDELLYVQYNGENDNRGEWNFKLSCDKIGEDGQMIYYYGKDFSMSYYPYDHHIHIETSNTDFCGDYWCVN